MTDTEKKIIEVIGGAIPLLSEEDQEKLLAFGTGVALIAMRKTEEEKGA